MRAAGGKQLSAETDKWFVNQFTSGSKCFNKKEFHIVGREKAILVTGSQSSSGPQMQEHDPDIPSEIT